MITQDDIGNFYIDEQNNAWQMVGWYSKPTAVLVNLATKEKIHLIPSAPIAQNYTKLVREE